MKTSFSVRDYNAFIHMMLCKRKRRHKLILLWNSYIPFKCSSLQMVVKMFFDCI